MAESAHRVAAGLLAATAIAILASACAGGNAPAGPAPKAVQVRTAGSLGVEPPAAGAGLGSDLGQVRGQNAAPPAAGTNAAPPPAGQALPASQQSPAVPVLGAPVQDRCSAPYDTSSRKPPLPACMPG